MRVLHRDAPIDERVTAMRSEPLHVGIDAASWSNTRGPGRVLRSLVAALAARKTGFRYTLVFDQRPEGNCPPGVEVLVAGTRRNLSDSARKTSRSIADLWRIGRLVANARFDVFFYPAVYSYFPLLSRTPCVVCYHDATAERYPEAIFPNKINRALWRLKMAMARVQATRAMTISETSARDLEDLLRIRRSRIDLITEAPDSAFRVLGRVSVWKEARARYGIPIDATLLVVVGAMNPYKNLSGLLAAMRKVVSTNPTVHLAIIGATTGQGFFAFAPRYMDFVKDNPPLDRHVHFTGYVSDESLVALLNGAAALVFPSLWEGFGLPAVEAMACGVPVLASSRGSLPEIVGEAGLFFEPEDPDAIAECIIRYVSHPEWRPRLSEIALRRAEAFTWERAAELAERCFRRCVDPADDTVAP